MPISPLKILLMGDASNCHRTLATGLRRLGHEVVVASDGTKWMDTERDIDLKRRWDNKLGGLDLWARIQLCHKRNMKGFDVVSIATQGYLPLRPQRQRILYDFLRTNNRAMFYTALGTDSNFVEECLDPDTPLRYNEFMIYGKPAPHYLHEPQIANEWLHGPLKQLGDHVYDTIDGAVGVLYEYNVALRRRLAPDKIAYGGIPIDTEAIRPLELPDRIDKVRLFLGVHRDRSLVKGAELLEAAAKAVVERHPGKAELVKVENLPYKQYLELLKSAHVVLDQVYSYTPATNALLAMTYGLNTISGGEPEFYDFIGEKENHPIINALPDYTALTGIIEETVLHPELIKARGLQGREFVERHHRCDTVARRFVDFWNQRLIETGK